MRKSFTSIAVALLFIAYSLQLTAVFAQETADLEFKLDTNAKTIPLPKIFRPNIDLSGRGFHRDLVWPQTLAAKEVLEQWEKDLGFGGIYRVQLSLWQIHKLSEDKDAQANLLANYEHMLKKITDAGGIVILNIFGTPQGMGRVLDKKSPPRDLKEFKRIIKEHIRNLSCNKKYNIWYEVWNAPDMDDFFLGRQQDYFNLYRAVAQAIQELRAETKIFIPLGGPSVSWWFQNLERNTILSAENSLIYDLIKFCYRYHLPLDFISWHAYSSSPNVEKENTGYNKSAIKLIRDWLSYFKYDPNTPLIIDEWNFDIDANISAERSEKSFICASYIPSRLKNMHEAGLDYQIYFSLEDFQNNKEGVSRNIGVFYFDPESPQYKGGPKSTYNIFKMLNCLGKDMFLQKFGDEFIGAIATKKDDQIILLFYNYIDSNIATNYISKHIATLSGAERKRLLRLIKSDEFEKVLRSELEIPKLRLTKKVKGLIKMAKALNDKAKELSITARNIKIEVENLKERYSYKRYTIDSSCRLDCPFEPVEIKDIDAPGPYQDRLAVNPYSVNMIILEKKPPEPEPEPELKSEPEVATKQISDVQDN